MIENSMIVEYPMILNIENCGVGIFDTIVNPTTASVSEDCKHDSKLITTK